MEELAKAMADFGRTCAQMAHALAEAMKAMNDYLTVNFGSNFVELNAYLAAANEHPKWVHMARNASRKRIRKKYHDRIMREYGGRKERE